MTKNLKLKIKKRNGRKQKFNIKKVQLSIEKAGDATKQFNEKIAERLSLKVMNMLELMEIKEPTVDDIGRSIEGVLMASSYKETARAYILYRDQHATLRDMAKTANINLVDKYLENDDWLIKENANMAFSLQGFNNYISSEISKKYWMNSLYPKEICEAHIHGDFHMHDLNLLAPYCCGWDLYDLLIEGITGVSGKIESLPANHFSTILGQIYNFLYTMQGEAAGALAFSNFDTLLAPFIRHDKLSYAQVKQELHKFLHNMNVPTRVGFQSPFTNVTLDLTVPKYYKDNPVIIGGKPQKETYKEFQKEMDMFNKALAEAYLRGDAKGRLFSFPIPTYNITKDFNWENPVLNPMWEMTAKYGVPYFANYINSDMNPEDSRSMCCRLRIDNRKLHKRGGGLFGAAPITGSIGVVTINMPRLGYNSKDEKEFFKNLEELMNLTKKTLEIKRKIIERFTDKGLYPYTKYYLRKVKERFNKYWSNHFSTIGLVGMNEACLNLLGESITTEKGQKFTEKVLSFMRDKIMKYQEETGNFYNLEATPAEGTSYRLAILDKKEDSDIICANEEGYKTDHKPFYTNSTHLPVNYSDDLFDVLDKQDKLQSMYTGGTVLHTFLGEKFPDIKQVKKLLKVIFEKHSLPYLSFTPTFSICPNCGYLIGEHFKCPECGKTSEVYSRIVGYIRPVQQWNEGKREEFKMRKVYKLNNEN